jgi:prepilin-type N-terminal cleavage/methylation domain-containing protein
MKTQRTSSRNRGFTLMELMVAMAITTIIVTVLVSITSIALETWNRSRSELRASRQAKAVLETMARDFESLVTRRGNTNEWLSAITDTTETQKSGNRLESTNAAKLLFFTAATDRYNGAIGVSGTDMGGDVSCVAYQLEYKDPIGSSGSGFETFVLSRLLVDPDDTFKDLLGKQDLTAAFSSYQSDLSLPANFVCENLFQFTVTFHVQATQLNGTTSTVVTVPVTLGKSSSSQSAKEFRIKGTGIVCDATGGSVTPEQLAAGKITAMEVSVTVISDFGIDQIKRRNFTPAQQADFLAKNSYQYTKLVQLPSM